MKSAKEHVLSTLTDSARDAVPHLTCGLHGKGQAHDCFAGQLRIGFKQMPDALRDDASLARPRPGNDQQRAFSMADSGALFGI